MSVRNAYEASLVSNFVSHDQVGILDVKEPSTGSLGHVSYSTAEEIACALEKSDAQMELSIALGEVIDGPVWPDISEHNRTNCLKRFGYAKAGLAGLASNSESSSWQKKAVNFFASLPNTVNRVAVAYVDEEIACSPRVEDIVHSAPSLGCSHLLFDTHSKGQGGLFDFYSPQRLRELISLAKADPTNELIVVVAGSLSAADLTMALSLQPDFIAVRGAVCGETREDSICAEKLTHFVECFTQAVGTISERQ